MCSYLSHQRSSLALRQLELVDKSEFLGLESLDLVLQVAHSVSVVLTHLVVLALLGGQQVCQRRLLAVQLSVSLVHRRHLPRKRATYHGTGRG